VLKVEKMVNLVVLLIESGLKAPKTLKTRINTNKNRKPKIFEQRLLEFKIPDADFHKIRYNKKHKTNILTASVLR